MGDEGEAARRQRLSVRTSQRSAELYEGLSAAMHGPIVSWLNTKFDERGAGGFAIPRDQQAAIAFNIALTHDIPLTQDEIPNGVVQRLLDAAERDKDLCLEILDAVLRNAPDGARPHVDSTHFVRQVLTMGGSAWTVAPDSRSLIRRIDPTAIDQFAKATSVEDDISSELKQAWAHTYGRDPDTSDAWDHAIKACEHALKPIVTPNNPAATLGSVVGQLRAQPPIAELILQDNGMLKSRIEPLDAFENLLHLIWPNPDRHGGGPDERVPRQLEAEAVVNLAVLVVQWARSGVLVKK